MLESALRAAFACAALASLGACTRVVELHVHGPVYVTREASRAPPAKEPERPPALVDPLDAVVRVASRGGECTGTLVDPRLVVTSRECYARITSEAEDAPNARLHAGVGGGAIAYRSANVVGVVSATCLDVLALVLDEPLSAPPLRLRLGASVALGEPVRIVGYGVCGSRPYSVRAIGFAGRIVDGDATTFAVDAPRCKGDSGAPVISDWTGEIVGVVLDDDPGAHAAGRLDVAVELLARGWLASHGARVAESIRCE